MSERDPSGSNSNASFSLVPEGGQINSGQKDINTLFAVAHPSPHLPEGGGGVPPINDNLPKSRRESNPLKKLMLGAGAIVTAAAVVVGANRMLNNSNESSKANTSDGVSTLTSEELGDSSNDSSNVIIGDAVSKEPSPEIKTTEIEGSRGKYKTIDEMPYTPEQKEAMKIMLKGSTPVIITDNMVIGIEDRMKYSTEPRQCPTELNSKQTESCGSLQDIELNIERFPDAEVRLNNGADRGHYNAIKAKSLPSLTFEEYLAQKKAGDLTYDMRVRNIYTNRDSIEAIHVNRTPIVWIFTYTHDPDFMVESSSTNAVTHLFGNDVLGVRDYVGGNIGVVSSQVYDKIDPEELSLALNIGNKMVMLADPKGIKLEGKGSYAIAYPARKITAEIYNEFIDPSVFNGTIDQTKHWPTIFKSKGIPPIKH